MTFEQIALFILLGAVMYFFISGRLRYDVIAIGALLIAVVIGVVPAGRAFSGFASAAVVTVAAVLIISRGLTNSGAVERVAHYLLPGVKSLTLQMSSLNFFTGGLSAVMNNVGALALLMPATISAAKKLKKSPSLFLMPLSFASILGGMVTLIGTPPNIIIASLREEYLGAPYTMFDFTPVGAVVAVVGILFLTLIGWRLLPGERKAQTSAEDLFQIEGYTAEVLAPKESKYIGIPLFKLDKKAHQYGIHIAGLIRNKRRILNLASHHLLEARDILLLEADPDDLDKFAHELGFQIKGDTAQDKAKFSSEDVVLVEAVVSADSRLITRRIGDLRLKSRYHINLLGVSRQGATLRKSLQNIKVRTGDVFLLQAERDTYPTTLSRLGLLPLAERGFSIGKRPQALIAAALLAGAVALAALGWLDLTIALTAAALGMVLAGIVPVQDIYESIDWPVIILVGAMIPIGGALQTVGATGLMADGLLDMAGFFDLPIYLILGLVMLVTMTLSDVMNNVATAVVMAPVGLAVAAALGVNPDTFLMAVAVGASCAFLTPIGHKNNALILGPGGYKFGDYWRMGLPLEVLILLVAVPMILTVWPL
ncbi:MAG: SLC13 family permease [Proteobacteria bacterium]|nr:SLC13 family permease [Pseudomonadota bacterium]